jgi:hypothetical protein
MVFVVVVVTVVVVIVVVVEIGGFFTTSGCCCIRFSRQQVLELFRSFVRKSCAVQPPSEKIRHSDINNLECLHVPLNGFP